MAEAPATARTLKLFATPVIVDQLEDCEALNEELEAAILARMRSDPGLRLSNQGGWQSRHDLPAWGGEAGRRLIRHAAALATANTATAQGATGLRWRIDAWANVSGSGHSNRSYVHGGSFWSAVYYVRVGAGKGGELLLHDPRMPALRMHAPDLRFKNAGVELVAPVKPKAGLMILFPAWLSHSVQPWEGGESRISVAMNIRAGAPAPAVAHRDNVSPEVSTTDPGKDQ
jgi:uncharacterized protein (TIGR02466 family)